jgi:Protein of unknown function (DUF3313)
MRIRQWFALAFGVAIITGAADAPGQAGSTAASSDLNGLVEVRSKDFDHVYLRPGADFRAYTKVMLDPTQVTFAKNWFTDMNFHRIAVLQGTTAADADRIAEEARSGLRSAFADAFRHAGYEIVSAPGAGVLGLSLRVIDLYINAPDTVTQALPSRVLTPHDAGHATLALEVRDSTTGALLGRFVDRRTAGIRGGSRSNVRITMPASNRFDFGSLFAVWAQNCIDELKVESPLAINVPAKVPPQ